MPVGGDIPDGIAVKARPAVCIDLNLRCVVCEASVPKEVAELKDGVKELRSEMADMRLELDRAKELGEVLGEEVAELEAMAVELQRARMAAGEYRQGYAGVKAGIVVAPSLEGQSNRT